MPKKFSRAVKDRAFKLYITDEYSVPEIAQQVSAEHRTVVNAQTIYAWVRQDDWKIKKVEVKEKAIEKSQDDEATRLVKMQSEHQQMYEAVRKKAAGELDLLTFERAFDAEKAMDIGIQGERQVAEGLIKVQFIQDVVNILVEEIEDPDLMAKIAAKLKVLMASEDNE